MKIEIKNDLFDIVSRLKEIDNDYFVLFNTKTNKYELHAQNQAPNSYCLAFPYTCLDERAIIYALKTRRQNSKKLFEEMQTQNERLLKKEQEKLLRSYYGS